MDDGKGGQFIPVYGLTVDSLSTSYTQTSNVQRGNLYRARYRVKNVIGWTDYSPIGYILAAVKPSQPPQPTVVSASSSSIVMTIMPSEDNGGSPIDKYELHRDDGNQGTYNKVYEGMSSIVTLDTTTDPGLSLGKVYRFIVRSHNVKGYSEYSPVVSAAFADLPAKPAAPTKITYLSTKTSIAVEWVLNTDVQLPGGAVTGYKLLIDDGLNGDFREVFYGKNVPSMHQFIVSDLIP